jgi:RNA polymerase sigma factor (sigma-70 family)
VKTTDEERPELTGIPSDNGLHALIARCNSGDESAWEEFYAQYFGLVSAAVKKYSRNGSEEIEDTVQEIFTNLFRALKRYDPEKPLEAYILEIARRVRISRYRNASALKRGGADRWSESINAHDTRDEAGCLSVASPLENQESSLIRAQETHLLRKALRSLGEACRSLLSMRYYQGLSYKEIGDFLGTREATLRVQVQRCLSSLGRIYSRVAPQEEGNT